jgi:hypothetical protein
MRVVDQIRDDGFVVLPGVYDFHRVEEIRLGLAAAFAGEKSTAAVLGDARGVYAARNVLSLWPAAADIWREPTLFDVINSLLGPQFGLVRALFFDKPPERNWALQWHRDLTIAVADNRLPSRKFSNPTLKAGVPHVQAPRHVLDQMITARIHLDRVTDENGPLQVIPGSHRSEGDSTSGDSADVEESAVHRVPILVDSGDLLLMRPRVLHCSGHSHSTASGGRRVLHLEFAASPTLPDGYAWHTFIAADRDA